MSHRILTLWLILLALLSATTAFCAEPGCSGVEAQQGAAPAVLSGTGLDASYFLDSDALETPPLAAGDAGLAPTTLAPGRRAFCSRSAADITREITEDPSSRLAFPRPPGIFGTGLCWWHSRLQRSAAYLANYFPGRPKPTPAETSSIIDRLIAQKSVVAIPGYANLHDFSKDHQDEITHKLDDWMLSSYVDGSMYSRVGDRSSVPPAELRATLDGLYDRLLSDPEILFLRIHATQYGWNGSHGLLLLSMAPARDPAAAPFSAPVGYTLKVIDSRVPAKTITIDYRYGDVNLGYFGAHYRRVVPHLAFDSELGRIRHALSAYCR